VMCKRINYKIIISESRAFWGPSEIAVIN
jgi:hypothetical protein